MRWILRYAVFVLCFGLGSTAWHILAQEGSTPAQPVEAAQASTVNQTIAPADRDEPEIVPGQSIKFGPLEPMNGYVNTETVVLRESADASAPVVAKLKAGDYERVEILGATRDFLHVRFAANDGSAADGSVERKQDYEGWTTWASVVPDMSAIVLDAETGAVVSRVPLGEEHTSVIFSPDGSRAIFSGQSSEISPVAYEVRTSDYTLMRSLTSPEKMPFSTLFYAPASGDLYAKVHDSGESLIRVGDGGAVNTTTAIAPHIIIAPDGLTGLIVRREEGNNQFDVNVDVMELATLEVRNTFQLTGSNLSSDGNGFVLSKDGSELYLRPTDNTAAISVFDTRTGQLLRELSGSVTPGWSHFTQGSVVGDSLLLRVWSEGEDEMHSSPKKFWLSNGKRVLAETEIDYAIEVGGKRYAVNEEGTLLFRLNDNNRIQKRFTISRPERREEDAGAGNGLTIFGLSASPDGKHIIMFVGMAHGC